LGRPEGKPKCAGKALKRAENPAYAGPARLADARPSGILLQKQSASQLTSVWQSRRSQWMHRVATRLL